MASTGKGKRRVKGKTVGLNSFLATDQDAPSGFAVINTNYNWGDVMEDTPVDDKFTLDYKDSKKDKIYLPTAPKAARGPDIDMSRVPTKPPFTAYVGNLPYDVNEEDIIKFFRQLKVTSVRLPREGGGERGRLRGFGYAEFADKQSLLEALSLNSESLKNRAIRVNLAGDHENERDHDRRDDRSDRTAGDWRAGGRDEGFSRDSRDDRQRNGTWYDRNDRSDRGGRGGRREGDSRDDFEWRRGDGFRREDRGYDRRDRSGYERRDYGNREREAPKERPKLQLKPRSLPLAQESANPVGSASIFGGAKPVDTAAKEREIEERLSKEKVIPEQRLRSNSEDDQHSNSSSTSTRVIENAKEYDADVHETKENIKHTGASTAAVFGGAKPVDTAARERQIEERLAREREQESRKPLSDTDRHSSSVRPPLSSRTGRYEGRSSSRQDDDIAPRAGSRGRTTYNKDHGSNSRENSYDRRDINLHHYGKEDEPERNRHSQYSQSSSRSDRRDRDTGKPLERNVQNAQEYAVPHYQEDKPPVYASTNKFLHLMPDDDDNGSTSE